MLRTLLALIVCLGLTAGAFAQPTITGGKWDLEPNQAGQKITINVSGGTDVKGYDLYFVLTGSGAMPKFTSVDMFTGTVFSGHQAGYYSSSFVQPQLIFANGETTPAGTGITTNGQLATIIIDTTGILEGDYSLLLSYDNGQGNFIPSRLGAMDTNLVNGSIHVPEPASMAMLLAGSVALLRRRRTTK